MRKGFCFSIVLSRRSNFDLVFLALSQLADAGPRPGQRRCGGGGGPTAAQPPRGPVLEADGRGGTRRRRRRRIRRGGGGNRSLIVAFVFSAVPLLYTWIMPIRIIGDR